MIEKFYKHFRLTEFTRSSTAERLGIDNTPSMVVVSHIDELVNSFLDPLREDYGKDVIVTSGYRCPKLNKAVGGSETSVHPLGYAADLQVKGSFDDFVAFVVKWVKRKDVPFDQILIERNKKTGARWLHVGIRNGRGQQRGIIKIMEV